MLNRPIVHFHELHLKKRHLASFSDEETALFGILAHISNELNVLSTLLFSCGVLGNGDDPIQFSKLVQHNVLMRTLSSKVNEAFKLLLKLRKKHTGYRQEIVGVIEQYSKKLDELEHHPGFTISGCLRSEISFHYDLGAALDNVKLADEELRASFYLSLDDGNSYFAFGEHLMFVQSLEKIGEKVGSNSCPKSILSTLVEWMIDVQKVIRKIQFCVFELVVLDTERSAKRTHYYLRADEVVEYPLSGLPVFVRRKE